MCLFSLRYGICCVRSKCLYKVSFENLKCIYQINSKNWKIKLFLTSKEASIRTVAGMLRGKQICLVGILRTGTRAQVNKREDGRLFFYNKNIFYLQIMRCWQLFGMKWILENLGLRSIPPECMQLDSARVDLWPHARDKYHT